MILDLTFYELLIRLVSGLLIGFTIGLTAIGGGVLVLPVLNVLLHLEPTVCVGTASFYATLTKVYAVFEHYRLRTVDFATSLWVLLGAVPANVTTACLINRYRIQTLAEPERLQAFQHQLKLLIVVVIFVAVGLMVNQVLRSRGQAAPGTPGARPVRPRWLAVLLGAVLGAVIGATAIVAVLVVPMLLLVFRLSAERTVGSSIFIGVVLTVVTAAIYGKSGQIDYPTGLIMAAGSFGGVYAGSRLTVRLPECWLKGAVTALVTAAAVMMLASNATR